MLWLISRLRRDVRAWDRATQIAFVIGVILLLVAVISALIAPPDARLSMLVGAGALLLVLEIAVLWGNRGMISPFTRAQRLYLDGDFAGVLDVLEPVRAKAGAKADARALALLGNTYRQLGRLHESEAVLAEAVEKAPQHYFSFYGFGRTLLSEGRYAEAVTALQRALDLGAPAGVRVDLGEAYFRLNQPEAAIAALHAADLREPHRALIAGYLLYRLGAAAPPSPERVRDGLPYWQAAAARFRETPYGAALRADVDEMVKQGTDIHG
jgi:tetratricopeptide (TPR) repeat protein